MHPHTGSRATLYIHSTMYMRHTYVAVLRRRASACVRVRANIYMLYRYIPIPQSTGIAPYLNRSVERGSLCGNDTVQQRADHAERGARVFATTHQPPPPPPLLGNPSSVIPPEPSGPPWAAAAAAADGAGSGGWHLRTLPAPVRLRRLLLSCSCGLPSSPSFCSLPFSPWGGGTFVHPTL